jgi:ligand-binding SRPBCC domain-containing protein
LIRIEEVTFIDAPADRCFDLARSVEVHLAGNIHFGEQAMATGGVTSGLIGLGQRVTWRGARHFGLRFQLTSEITAMQTPSYFEDVMIKGPFQSMRHDHYFRSLPAGGTEMKDVFCVTAPLGLLGRLAEALVLGRYMRALLQERNRVLKQIAEGADWQRYLAREFRS